MCPTNAGISLLRASEVCFRGPPRRRVETVLDQLPEKFTTPIYEAKCNVVYEHVFESYWDDGRSVYDVAA